MQSVLSDFICNGRFVNPDGSDQEMHKDRFLSALKKSLDDGSISSYYYHKLKREFLDEQKR